MRIRLMKKNICTFAGIKSAGRTLWKGAKNKTQHGKYAIRSTGQHTLPEPLIAITGEVKYYRPRKIGTYADK